VFSITIVALAFAAGQYGPRILTNFMSNRGNQVTLGTFIGTFVYCLVVLRTIRGGEESEFVPQLAVMVALLLALCSIGVLIYFIHHVPQSIHVNSVIAKIGRQLITSVGDRYPDFIGRSPEGDEIPARVWQAASAGSTAQTWSDHGAVAVEAGETGYLQSIDDEELMSAAEKIGAVVKLDYRPGDFVHAGRPLLHVAAPEELPDDAEDRLRRTHSVGAMRTPSGDLAFLVDELVEIAARALSSGVNDPYTAMTCLDWLGAGASEIGRREMPSPLRVGEDGALRVIAKPETFENFVERAFGRMRQYAARDMNASIHALIVLDQVAQGCSDGGQAAALRREAGRLIDAVEHALQGVSLDRVRQCHAKLERLAS
jgi:uncharacterized membrane protein